MNRPRSPKNRQCHHFLNLIATLRIHYSFLISLRPPKHCAKLFEQIKKTDDVHAFSRLSSSLVLARSLSLVFRVEVFIVVPQKPHQLRIAMRPAEIDRPVQCTKSLHFFRCQLKVKHVEVLLHPIKVRSLRYRDNVSFDEIAQRHLLRCFAVFGSQPLHQRVILQLRIALRG